MVRSALGKVAWAGRTASMVFGLALVMALIFGAASVGLAANGQPFLLGKVKNTATQVTGLIGKVASGPALKVTNPSGGSALGLQVNAGQAPLTVNADAGTATNLDADQLDNREASSFANGVDGKATDADRLDGKDSSGFVANNVYKIETPGSTGSALADGTRILDQGCAAGDTLLTGGPASIDVGTSLLESFPTPGSTNSWRVRIQNDSTLDSFKVVVLCANQ